MSSFGAIPEAGSARQILIVEDEFLLAMAMEQALLAAGYAVIGIAGDGAAALAAVQTRRPDLVVTDVKLRGQMDGVTLAILFREQFRVPALLVSGNLDGVTRQRAACAAPAGFLEKPYSEMQFIRAVETALTAESPTPSGHNPGPDTLTTPGLGA